MKVAILGEYSGAVRDAFIALGHDAISVDLLPTEAPGPHWQGDLFRFMALYPSQDMIIAHPTCTYLCSCPDSYSAHIGDHEILCELPEHLWQQWDKDLHKMHMALVDKWQAENHPDEYARAQQLKQHMDKLRKTNRTAFRLR